MSNVAYGYFYDAHDLFCGVGWDAAARSLGVTVLGADNDMDVIHMRNKNHLDSLYIDLWGTSPSFVYPKIKRLIGSPTCKTFSVAGGKTGLEHVDDLMGLVARVGNGERVKDVAGYLDPEIGLVLTPLEWIVWHEPEIILLEQVVQVLPIWSAYADVLALRGYSTVVAQIEAEQYGAAQTRSRAYLYARNDGVVAKIPPPTHSKFHYQRPDRFDDGVQRWVSAHEALNLSNDIFAMQSNYSAGGRGARLGSRNVSLPASTVTTKMYNCKWLDGDGAVVRSIEIDELAHLQGFPEWLDWNVLGKKAAAKLIGNAVEGNVARTLIAAMMEGR